MVIAEREHLALQPRLLYPQQIMFLGIANADVTLGRS
jgi:hypothetical protein